MKTTILNSKKLLYLKLLLIFLFVSTVHSQTIQGDELLEAGETKTYSVDAVATFYLWSATGGLEIEGANDQSTVQVKRINCTNGKLYLLAYDNPSNTTFGEIDYRNFCDDRIIYCTAPPQCNLPNVTIEDYLCVTNSHPYWRFGVPNISGATYTWSGQHFNLISGENTNYMIGNPTDNGFGFTVYCKIKKTCSNGLTDERTFYYESNANNSCNQGTTGEIGGSGGGPIWTDLGMTRTQAEDPLILSSNPKKETFSISPNPLKETSTITIILQNENKNRLTIEIYDIYGRLVHTPVKGKPIKKEYSLKIHKSDLPRNGIYFVSFYVNGELKAQKKIISQN